MLSVGAEDSFRRAICAMHAAKEILWCFGFDDFKTICFLFPEKQVAKGSKFDVVLYVGGKLSGYFLLLTKG